MPVPVLLIWLSAVALGAYTAIDGEYRGRSWQLYIGKPITTVLIALGALWVDSGLYRWLLLAGLVCSLAGDIFLMLPRDRFLPGLLSFLIAHGFYIAALAHGLSWSWPPGWAIAALLTVWLLGMLVLLPGARGARAPVAIYVLALLLLIAAALARGSILGGVAWFAVAGALLFGFSDSTIGFNRFVRPFRAAQGVILGTYFPAQTLLVLAAPGIL